MGSARAFPPRRWVSEAARRRLVVARPGSKVPRIKIGLDDPRVSSALAPVDRCCLLRVGVISRVPYNHVSYAGAFFTGKVADRG